MFIGFLLYKLHEQCGLLVTDLFGEKTEDDDEDDDDEDDEDDDDEDDEEEDDDF